MKTPNPETKGGELASKSTWILVFVGALLALLAGCAGERVDQGLLTGEPCAPPCWYGIVPGVTDEADLQAKLKASSHTLAYTGTALTGIDTCPAVMDYEINTADNTRVAVLLHNDMVRTIDFSVKPGLTLEETIEHFGPPEALDVYLTGEEAPILSVSLWYPSKGLLIDGWRSRNFGEKWTASAEDGLYTVQLNENMRLNRVVYYAPGNTMKDALLSILCQSERMATEALTELREWEGFGEMRVQRH